MNVRIRGPRKASKSVVWDMRNIIPYSARKIVSSIRSDLIWNCFYSETLIKILCHLLEYCQFVTVQHNNASRKKAYNLFILFSFTVIFAQAFVCATTTSFWTAFVHDVLFQLLETATQSIFYLKGYYGFRDCRDLGEAGGCPVTLWCRKQSIRRGRSHTSLSLRTENDTTRKLYR